MNRRIPVALATLALIAAPTVAVATPNPTVDEWHTWTVTEVFTDTPRDAGDVAWPQSYLGAGSLTPSCGWAQQDRYKGKRSQIDAILADNTLTYGEDFGVVKEWRYVYAGPCTTPTPTPTPTVTPTPEPTPTATPEPTPTPTATPKPEPTPKPTPTPEPTVTPKPLPTTTPVPGPSRRPTPAAGIGTPEYTEAPQVGVDVLAETGNDVAWGALIFGILAAAAGAGLIQSIRRKKARA